MFISPTRGRMTCEEMLADIVDYMLAAIEYQYKIIVGTDSQMREETCLVTAVVVHRVGKGARYYYRKKKHRRMQSLRQRLFYEAALSLETASRLTSLLAEKGYADLDLEIHLDVGPKGETKEMIRELVGMIVGSGFDARIKPDSFGASKVADKHTK
ncbi:MAG: ribonuclease H-like YkuK family protein [Bacillota bacterium]|jgi:predicted RNase H-related nuclease YkuK (DUF458 family)